MALVSSGRLGWKRLRWHAAHLLRRRAVGMLLAGAAVLLFATVVPWWREAAQQHRQAELQRRATGHVPAPPGLASDPRLGRLQAFYATLPPQEEMPGVLQELIELAEKEKLRFPRGSYRLEREPQAGFSRYRMTLPLRGDADKIQHLIGTALQAFPTLAVESVRYRRDEVDEHMLEVSVQWVLFVRAANAAGSSGS